MNPTADEHYARLAILMKVNIDILKKDLSAHIDKEIQRFRIEMKLLEKKNE